MDRKMNAGLVLKDDTSKDSHLVFLGEEVSCYPLSTNKEITDLVGDREPKVLAVDVGTDVPREELNKKEEELKEEGHVFTPTSHEPKRARRLEALKAHLFEEMGAERPEVIRFEPQITADELAIHDDSGVESYGVDPSKLENSEQFDAMLGAITARFYEQNQIRDLGVIIPEPLGDSD